MRKQHKHRYLWTEGAVTYVEPLELTRVSCSLTVPHCRLWCLLPEGRMEDGWTLGLSPLSSETLLLVVW